MGSGSSRSRKIIKKEELSLIDAPLNSNFFLLRSPIVDSIYLKLGSIIDNLEGIRTALIDELDDIILKSGVLVYKEINIFRIGKCVLRKIFTDHGGELKKLSINVYQNSPIFEVISENGPFAEETERLYNSFRKYINSNFNLKQKIAKFGETILSEEKRVESLQNAIFYYCLLETKDINPNSEQSSIIIQKIDQNQKLIANAANLALILNQRMDKNDSEIHYFSCFMCDFEKLKKLALKCKNYFTQKKPSTVYEISLYCVKKANQTTEPSKSKIMNLQNKIKARALARKELKTSRATTPRQNYNSNIVKNVKILIVACVSIQNLHTKNEKLLAELLKLYDIDACYEKDFFNNKEKEYSMYFINKNEEQFLVFTNQKGGKRQSQTQMQQHFVCDEMINKNNFKKVLDIIWNRTQQNN